MRGWLITSNVQGSEAHCASERRGGTALPVRAVLAAALALAGATAAVPAGAIVFEGSVAGTAMPSLWDDTTGFNAACRFAVGDGTGPLIINFGALGFSPGDPWGILWVGGLTNAFGGVPDADNGGDFGSVFKNDVLGSSGEPFPSFYLPGEWGPPGDPIAGVYLNAPVGAFALSDGTVVAPFSLGTHYPDGARLIGVSTSYSPAFHGSRMQLGLNDDIFADNTGSLLVCVDRADDSCFRKCYGGGRRRSFPIRGPGPC